MKKSIVISIFVLMTISSFSQQKLPDFSASSIVTQSFGYNFFVGNDSKRFQTTPRAFGSGLYDLSATYTIYNYWISRPIKHNIGLLTTIGFDLTKYRFTDNLVFDIPNTQIFVDTNANHHYDNSFFSRQGSKLVIGRLYVPLLIYFPVSHWFKSEDEKIGLFAGVIYRPYLFSYQKLFYIEDNKLVKNKLPASELSIFFNKHDISLKAGIKLWNIIIFGQYSYFSLFNSLMPYDIHEAKIGLSFTFNTNKLKDIDKKDEDSDIGTDAK